jgi:hypothetical protein
MSIWKLLFGNGQRIEESVEPRPSGSFDDEFRWLSALVGGPDSVLRSALGAHNDADRAWVWFESVHASFCLADGRVIRISVPTVDAFGHRLTEANTRYLLGGVRPGMTKAQVMDLWGEPSSGNYDDCAWRYDQKASRTRSGAFAVPILYFGVESEILETFEARLKG